MTKSLLLVHGAWHNGAGFDALVAELAKHDIAATTVELTSVGHEDAPLGDLYSDAALVREVVAALGDDVAVLGHSYGGVVITEALAGVDNVSHLIYLTAFMLDEGESLYAACGSVDPDWWVRSSDDQRLSTYSRRRVLQHLRTIRGASGRRRIALAECRLIHESGNAGRVARGALHLHCVRTRPGHSSLRARGHVTARRHRGKDVE